LKLKVAAAIVAISCIHVLRIFMNADGTPNDKIMWYVVLHAAARCRTERTAAPLAPMPAAAPRHHIVRVHLCLASHNASR
jgi:hypothetical protein